MPINYKNYPPDWKTRIRPDILEREGHKCKFCKVPNGIVVCRGTWGGVEVWQDDDGQIFRADNGEFWGESYVGDVWGSGQKRGWGCRIVLTVAHLDHDITNNNYENLAALCQKCHNNHDKEHRKGNRRKTLFQKKGGSLF